MGEFCFINKFDWGMSIAFTFFPTSGFKHNKKEKFIFGVFEKKNYVALLSYK